MERHSESLVLFPTLAASLRMGVGVRRIEMRHSRKSKHLHPHLTGAE
jgi:hypothetical protein